MGRLDSETLWTLAVAAFSTDWSSERRSVRRTLRHYNRFMPSAFVLSIALLVFYTVLSTTSGHGYECSMWTLELHDLTEAMFPWKSQLLHRPLGAPEAFFTFFTLVVYLILGVYWGPQSQYGRDHHHRRSQKVYSGLQHIVDLYATYRNEMLFQRGHRVDVKGCLNQWACECRATSRTQGVAAYFNGQKRTCIHQIAYVMSYPLTSCAALLLAAPNVVYILAKNVEPESIPAFFRNRCHDTNVISVWFNNVVSSALPHFWG